MRRFHITVSKEVCHTYTFEVEASNEEEAKNILQDNWGKDGFEKLLVGESVESDNGLNERISRYSFVDAIEV